MTFSATDLHSLVTLATWNQNTDIDPSPDHACFKIFYLINRLSIFSEQIVGRFLKLILKFFQAAAFPEEDEEDKEDEEDESYLTITVILS